jgi:hypothetical protein
MSEVVAARREAAALLYESAGREITLNFDNMNANLSLAAGALAAVLSVLGAGELFRHHAASETVAGIPRLSPVSLLVLALLLPLLMRFFVRTMLAYTNLLRFNRLQKVCLAYVDGRGSWEWLELERTTYLDHWKSPLTLGKAVLHNLEYGYFWILVVALTAFIWADATCSASVPRVIGAGIFAVGFLWEVVIMTTLRRWFFTLPGEEVRCKLRELEERAHAEGGAEPIPDAEDAIPIEVTSGIFVGRRRLLRPRRPRPGS